MPRYFQASALGMVLITSFFVPLPVAIAQSAGNTASVSGTVTDPTGAVIPDAVVELRNPVSGFHRVVITDTSGNFGISNVPLNPYHLTVNSRGFASHAQDVDVRS